MNLPEKENTLFDLIMVQLGSNKGGLKEDIVVAVKQWLELNRSNWKGNNLIAKSECETIDWAIDELIEGIV